MKIILLCTHLSDHNQIILLEGIREPFHETLGTSLFQNQRFDCQQNVLKIKENWGKSSVTVGLMKTVSSEYTIWLPLSIYPTIIGMLLKRFSVP